MLVDPSCKKRFRPPFNPLRRSQYPRRYTLASPCSSNHHMISDPGNNYWSSPVRPSSSRPPIPAQDSSTYQARCSTIGHDGSTHHHMRTRLCHTHWSCPSSPVRLSSSPGKSEGQCCRCRPCSLPDQCCPRCFPHNLSLPRLNQYIRTSQPPLEMTEKNIVSQSLN